MGVGLRGNGDCMLTDTVFLFVSFGVMTMSWNLIMVVVAHFCEYTDNS